MQRAGPTPRGGERRACRVVAGNHLENMIRVGGALDSPHPILPAVPPAASALGGDQRPLYLIRYMWARPRLGDPQPHVTPVPLAGGRLTRAFRAPPPPAGGRRTGRRRSRGRR